MSHPAGAPESLRVYHRRVTGPGRYFILASLPALGGFRRALALDRAGAARAVVLAFAPPAVADDPARLAALLRDVEAAARLHHPGAATVVGTETVDGELAVVELHRPGATLRALLDASGRLPPDVAARVALDASAALARAHAVDAGDGVRLVHGAVDAARIVVGEDGSAFVCGLGLAGGGDPAKDLLALGAVLHEVLAGEPPGEPPQPLGVPGIPAALAAAVDRATGAAGPPFPSAAALGEAIAAASPPAAHAAVAAYADAVLPADEGERAELGRALASALGVEAEEVPDDLIVEATDPHVRASIAAPRQDGPTAPPRTPDAVGTFPKPRPRRGSRLPLFVGLIGLAAGLAAGFTLSRRVPTLFADALRAVVSAAPATAELLPPARAPAAAPPALAPELPEPAVPEVLPEHAPPRAPPAAPGEVGGRAARPRLRWGVRAARDARRRGAVRRRRLPRRPPHRAGERTDRDRRRVAPDRGPARRRDGRRAVHGRCGRDLDLRGHADAVARSAHPGARDAAVRREPPTRDRDRGRGRAARARARGRAPRRWERGRRAP